MRVTMPSIGVGAPLAGHRGRADRVGDTALFTLTVVASLTVIAAIVAITYKVVSGAEPSISHFGIGFLGHNVWTPNFDIYGAAAFLYGTAVTSAMALVLAMPIGIAIGLFLSLLAPRRLAAILGPLVELLAAIPSVVLGLWGIIVLAPFLRDTLEPALNSALGWIPIFGAASPTGLGIFTAGVILTIMVVPIVASISRELFQSVPGELKDGALALGTTRWEMVRGVVLASTRPGLAATAILGLSRALGEAIAVTQVIGGGSQSVINTNFFANGDTLASRIATQFPGTTKLQTASLFYLAAILLVIGLLVNLVAQLILRRGTLNSGGIR
jgi:phosphate transport system permease protein